MALFAILVTAVIFSILACVWHCPHDLVWPVKGELEDEYFFICARCKAGRKKVNGEWKWIQR